MVNTGQMLMVLGAILLFSLMLPSLNGTILYSDSALITSQAQISAMALAQRYLSEAATKAFDENCISGNPTLPSQMTPVVSLGKEGGENYPGFDDLDDYINLMLVDSTSLPSIIFNIRGAVTYADPANPSNTSLVPTFLKRVRITVSGPYLADPGSQRAIPIFLEQIFAYY